MHVNVKSRLFSEAQITKLWPKPSVLTHSVQIEKNSFKTC